MNKISCNVCMDLISLIKDNVASEDSRLLVEDHIKTCNTCKLSYLGKNQLETQIDDKILVRKIENQLSYYFIALILIGSVFGMMLTNSMNMFYNALIMPTIGGLGYLLLRKKSAILPIGLFIFAFIWQTIQFYFTEGIPQGSSILDLFQMSLFYSVIYTLFSIIGIVIAWLLHYAFRRDTK